MGNAIEMQRTYEKCGDEWCVFVEMERVVSAPLFMSSMRRKFADNLWKEGKPSSTWRGARVFGENSIQKRGKPKEKQKTAQHRERERGKNNSVGLPVRVYVWATSVCVSVCGKREKKKKIITRTTADFLYFLPPTLIFFDVIMQITVITSATTTKTTSTSKGRLLSNKSNNL